MRRKSGARVPRAELFVSRKLRIKECVIFNKKAAAETKEGVSHIIEKQKADEPELERLMVDSLLGHAHTLPREPAEGYSFPLGKPI